MVSWCRSGKIGEAWFCADNFPVKELGLSFNISHVSGDIPTLHINADMIWVNAGIKIKLWPKRKQPANEALSFIHETHEQFESFSEQEKKDYMQSKERGWRETMPSEAIKRTY